MKRGFYTNKIPILYNLYGNQIRKASNLKRINFHKKKRK